MKTINTIFLLVILAAFTVNAQVAINTDGSSPDQTSMLDIKASDKGLLIPRLALISSTNPISGSKQNGLLVWNTSTTGAYDVPGFYYWNGSNWLKIANGSDLGSKITDADDDTYITVEETADDDTIRFFVAGNEVMKHDGKTLHMTDAYNNVFIGNKAGEANTDGELNIAVGGEALLSNTTGDSNIAIGGEALERNEAGNGNIAIGNRALFKNDNGFGNTALGSQAGYQNISGDNNVFLGKFAGYNETGNKKLYIENSQALPEDALIYGDFDTDELTFNANVGIGTTSPGAALDVNGHIWQTGTGESVFVGEETGLNDDLSTNQNVGIGFKALHDNTTGQKNTAVGYQAGHSNVIGESNSIFGFNSGYNNTASNNSFFGAQSGLANTTGWANTFLGSNTGRFNNTGNRNTFIGYNSGYSNNDGSGNVLIGYNAGAGENGSDKLFIENSNADSTEALIYGDFDEDRLTINGNMGINNTEPTEALDVDGSIKIKDGSQGDNKVLVSDADGKASWKKVTEVATGVMSPNFPNGLEGIIPVSVAVNDNSSYQVPAKVTLYILNVYSNNTNNLQIDGLPLTYGYYNYSDGTNPTAHLNQPLLVGTGSVVSGSDANDIVLNGYLVGNGTGGTEQPWECGDMLVDERDGQSYPTVQIGTQCWMAKNLNIGTRIDGANDMADNSIIEKYCNNDDPSNCSTYGGLYQWDEMMQYVTTEGVQGICPTGWHLPTDAEYTTLTDHLGGASVAGGKMKETGTSHWNSPNTGATNESGFTGLPGGYSIGGGSSYYSVGSYGNLWSTTQYSPSSPWYRSMYYGGGDVGRHSNNKAYGFSVRCLRD